MKIWKQMTPYLRKNSSLYNPNSRPFKLFKHIMFNEQQFLKEPIIKNNVKKMG